VTLTNDPLPPSHIELPITIEDGVVICANSTILPGAVLKTGAFISANSLIDGVVEEGNVTFNNKSLKKAHVTSLIDINTGIRHPWMRHFADKYPAVAQERIKILLDKIIESKKQLNKTK